MLERGDNVIAAVSGGMDSVVLLHVLMKLQDEHNLDLSVIHLNHSMRGAESKRDFIFVKALAKNMGLKFIGNTVNAPEIIKKEKGSAQDIARKIRYNFFEDAAKKYKAGKIATAHTLDDNAETVLMRIIKGTSLKGLRGIPFARGIFIRPLLEIKKAEIERLQIEKLKNLEIDAKAVISVKVDSQGNEKILFEKNSEEPLPIASLTKLMTALVVFDLNETYYPSQLITITKEAVLQEGSSKYSDLRIGEELSVEELLHIMLIESSNDAAFALSQPLGQEGFEGVMDLYARNLGLLNTQFANPTGLESDNPEAPKNFSTAKDLSKLAKYILKNYPQIFEITNKRSYEVLKPDGSVHHFIPQNTNELLGEIPEIIGGKTGWSPEAGGCLLLVLKNSRDNNYYINVI